MPVATDERDCLDRAYRKVIRYRRTPYGRYMVHKFNARARGVAFELSFHDWWIIWLRSGHWQRRGNRHGYVMCRYGDQGTYRRGNVYIGQVAHNLQGARKRCNIRRRHTARYTEVTFDE